MPEVSVATSVITTLGTVLAALGGIGMTQGIGARIERQKSERRRVEESVRRRDRTCGDLMAAARKLRLQIAVTSKGGRWKDMDVRLAAIQEQAAVVNQHVSHVALLAGEDVVVAARDLGRHADDLAGFVAEKTEMTPGAGSEGVLGEEPDFTAYEACLKEFEALARESQADGPSGPGRRMR
ncbi:MAG: hypothetical protein JWR24_5088 [Actinoallomurus sp.]|jgi:hypothetical protein|nr:hypothetical protein [Actinoallomurus sp.]